MEKDSFLDTNIVFNYSNYTDMSGGIVKKCYLFIKNKKAKFILCWAVVNELEKIIKKRARIHKEVLEKIKDPERSLDESGLISKRDVPYAKKLYEKFKNLPIEKVERILQQQRNFSEIKIDKFLQTQVDEKVISTEQIKRDLVNKIHEIISNHADCKILASALQLQKDRPIFLFVTADDDFDLNGYQYLKEYFEINYSQDDYDFPELFNLIYSK